MKLTNFNFKEHPYTSIAAIIVVAIFPLMVLFGIISPDQQAQYADYLTQLSGAIETHTWGAVITLVATIILAFIPDKRKK